MSHQMLAGCLIGKPVWRLDVTEVTFCWDSRGVAWCLRVAGSGRRRRPRRRGRRGLL